jgi:hypothetical protein
MHTQAKKSPIITHKPKHHPATPKQAPKKPKNAPKIANNFNLKVKTQKRTKSPKNCQIFAKVAQIFAKYYKIAFFLVVFKYHGDARKRERKKEK